MVEHKYRQRQLRCSLRGVFSVRTLQPFRQESLFALSSSHRQADQKRREGVRHGHEGIRLKKEHGQNTHPHTHPHTEIEREMGQKGACREGKRNGKLKHVTNKKKKSQDREPSKTRGEEIRDD